MIVMSSEKQRRALSQVSDASPEKMAQECCAHVPLSVWSGNELIEESQYLLERLCKDATTAMPPVQSSSGNSGDLLLIVLFLALVALMLVSLTIGRYPVPIGEVARIVFTTLPFDAVGSYEDKSWVAVEIVRMPRILLVTICGMGLALSGAVLQGVFRNPLVDPEIIGLTSGASLGGVIAIVLGWPTVALVGFAFGSGLLTLFVAFALAALTGRASTLAMVLSGVIVGHFCSAIIGLLQTLVDPAVKLPSLLYWLLGSFVGATYDEVGIAAAVTLLAGARRYLRCVGVSTFYRSGRWMRARLVSMSTCCAGPCWVWRR
jgi:hypothetical protein